MKQEKAISDILIAMDRIGHGPNSCLGILNFNDQFTNFTLEDPPRNKKIPKRTAIPIGTYEIKLRYEGGMYEKYSKKYGEPHPMLWLQNIPNFTYVYIHPLNFHYQTDGCIGTGDRFNMSGKDYALVDSVKAYEELYFPTRDALKAGSQVFIVIRSLALRKKTLFILENTSLRDDVPEDIKANTGLEIIPGSGKLIIDKDQLAIPWYHFYRKNGFKRITAVALGVGAIVVKVFAPELDVAVDGLTGLATMGGIIGGADALKKNREKNRDTYVDNSKSLSFIADLLIKVIKFAVKLLTKKGDKSDGKT